MKEGKQIGTVLFEEGKFFLQVEDHRRELPTEFLVDESQLEQVVGKDVEVIYAEPAIHALRWPGWGCVICYLPVPPRCGWWDGWGLGDETRAALLKTLHTEGWISQEILEKALESKAGS